jgi:hypothetical protein
VHEKQISKLVNSTRGGDWSAREKWEENGHITCNHNHCQVVCLLEDGAWLANKQWPNLVWPSKGMADLRQIDWSKLHEK